MVPTPSGKTKSLENPGFFAVPETGLEPALPEGNQPLNLGPLRCGTSQSHCVYVARHAQSSGCVKTALQLNNRHIGVTLATLFPICSQRTAGFCSRVEQTLGVTRSPPTLSTVNPHPTRNSTPADRPGTAKVASVAGVCGGAGSKKICPLSE